jgi:hypothetical protein
MSERETVVELPFAADRCPCVGEAAHRVTINWWYQRHDRWVRQCKGEVGLCGAHLSLQRGGSRVHLGVHPAQGAAAACKSQFNRISFPGFYKNALGSLKRSIQLTAAAAGRAGRGGVEARPHHALQAVHVKPQTPVGALELADARLQLGALLAAAAGAGHGRRHQQQLHASRPRGTPAEAEGEAPPGERERERESRGVEASVLASVEANGETHAGL